MSEILEMPAPYHHHSVDGPLDGGLWPSEMLGTTVWPPHGTTGICSCSTVVVWRGSPGGMVSWWPEGRWERRRRLRRERRRA